MLLQSWPGDDRSESVMMAGSSRHSPRTRKSEMKSQKTAKPHSPHGKQAAVSQCGCLWGHLLSTQYALHMSGLGRMRGHLTNGLDNVTKNTRFECLLRCVFEEGKKWSGGHCEARSPGAHRCARLEEGTLPVRLFRAWHRLRSATIS